MAQPSLRYEGQVQENGCDTRAGYKEGLEAEGTNVGNVGDGLAGIHRWVVWVADDFPPDQHGQQHAQPRAGGDDGKDPVRR